jgi:hypothetical protein
MFIIGFFWISRDYREEESSLSNHLLWGLTRLKLISLMRVQQLRFLLWVSYILTKINRKPKAIYFQKDESKASITWKDDRTVIIDDVTLRVPRKIFDYRRK